MSYVITAIISMILGAVLALLVRNSGNISAEERAFKDGREIGYAEGHRDGFREGIKRMSAIKNGRVDVAPGPDSIRPEGKAHD
jgi:hypothetical protein